MTLFLYRLRRPLIVAHACSISQGTIVVDLPIQPGPIITTTRRGSGKFRQPKQQTH
jgi:hypothetical protein